jgi:hypothetical protein
MNIPVCGPDKKPDLTNKKETILDMATKLAATMTTVAEGLDGIRSISMATLDRLVKSDQVRLESLPEWLRLKLLTWRDDTFGA